MLRVKLELVVVVVVVVVLATVGLVACDGAAGEGEGEGEGEGDVAVSDLPTNCIDPASSAAPACDTTEPAGGTIGSGPFVLADIGVDFGGGFIDGDHAVVVVSGDSQSGYGFVLDVDLTNGNRTVLSGQFNDPQNGNQTVGDGPDWNEPFSVSKGPDGLYVGALDDIYRVDAGGNRTAFTIADVTCDANGVTLFPSTQVSVDDAGHVFAAAEDAVGDGGVVELTSDSCTVLSWSGNPAASEDPIAAGASFSRLNGVSIDGGKMLGADFVEASIFSVDLTTGQRTRISSWSSDAPVGAGDDIGTQFVRKGAAGIWTSGSPGETVSLGLVDPASGDRTLVPAVTGSLSFTGHIVVIGQYHNDVVVGSGGSIHLVDPATGDSNRISR